MAFRVAAAQCKKICPEWLNWPGRLAGISKGHRGISIQFFQDHFSPSLSSQKWCQIFVRIFCVLPGTKNLQCLVSLIQMIFSLFSYFTQGRLISWVYEQEFGSSLLWTMPFSKRTGIYYFRVLFNRKTPGKKLSSISFAS
jgi:hypothetical protein